VSVSVGGTCLEYSFIFVGVVNLWVMVMCVCFCVVNLPVVVMLVGFFCGLLLLFLSDSFRDKAK
jgi:hypothetical protein